MRVLKIKVFPYLLCLNMTKNRKKLSRQLQEDQILPMKWLCFRVINDEELASKCSTQRNHKIFHKYSKFLKICQRKFIFNIGSNFFLYDAKIIILSVWYAVICYRQMGVNIK